MSPKTRSGLKIYHAAVVRLLNRAKRACPLHMLPHCPATSAMVRSADEQDSVKLWYRLAERVRSRNAKPEPTSPPNAPTSAAISPDGKKLHVEYTTKAKDSVDITRTKDVSPSDGSPQDKRLLELIDVVRKQSQELQELRGALKRIESRGEPQTGLTDRIRRFRQPDTSRLGAGAGGTSASPKESGTSMM